MRREPDEEEKKLGYICKSCGMLDENVVNGAPYCSACVETAGNGVYLMAVQSAGITTAMVAALDGERPEDEQLREDEVGLRVGAILIDLEPRLALLILAKLFSATAEHVLVEAEEALGPHEEEASDAQPD